MIRAEGLCKRFDDFTAVHEVDLHVEAGEILALLGPNGAGKTTTVRMLASILKPSSGRAQIVGHDTVQEATKVRRLVGVLTETPGLYSRMRAREYLDFFGQLQEMDRETRTRRGEALMEQLGMEDAWPLRLGEYSKGMRQKLALIRALLHDPPVLLLDEPTSAMDPQSAKVVRDCILALRRQDRATILCTHNLAEAEMLSDRIAIIRQGQIIALGTVQALRRRLLGAPLFELQLGGSVDGLASLISDLVQIEEQGPDWVRYRTERYQELNPLVLRRLLDTGHRVLTLSEVRRSLEEIYLQVVAEVPASEQMGASQ